MTTSQDDYNVSEEKAIEAGKIPSPKVVAAVSVETVSSSIAEPAKVILVNRLPNTILAFLAIVYSLYFGRPFLIPVLMSVYLWLILRPVVRFLNKRLKLPLALASAMVLALFLGTLITGISSLEAPAQKWIEQAPLTFEQMDKKLITVKKQIKSLIKTKNKIEDMTALEEKKSSDPVAVPIRPESIGSRLITGTQSFLVSSFTVFILVFFLLSSGDMFLLKLVRVSQGLRNKIKTVEAAYAIEQEIARYLGALSIINLALGTATGLGLWWLGMPNPVLWGVMVALFNYVPYVGPTVSLLTLAGVALMVMPTLTQALLVPGLFLVLTSIEGQVLQPLIIAKHLSINPVIIFLSLLFWGWMWGVVGLLIAVPMLVVTKIVCSHLAHMSYVVEFLEKKT